VGSDVGDFNKDGTPDFVMGSYSNRGIVAYRNNRYAPPPPPAPLISILEPLGNTVWSGGSIRQIGWNAYNGTPPYNITLAYRVGAAPAVTIAVRLPRRPTHRQLRMDPADAQLHRRPGHGQRG